ncbi:helix-turn-helix domain-containing protein [Dactylosporangium sp. CA-233914]|uniref:helix-turn-helix domain-containing protein n=1 Tax=Dactylosporangium sp. CA-233914 TaxID=3239934 RepID=UPI003D8B6EEF
MKYAYAGSAAYTHDRYESTTDYSGMMATAANESETLLNSGVRDLGLRDLAEVGPGNGRHSVAFLLGLAERGRSPRRYLGLDFSATLLGIAAARIRERVGADLALDTEVWDVEERRSPGLERWRSGDEPVVMCMLGGPSFECLQVRLSPVVAHAVLGATPELSGAVAALDDLWGREAARLQERLRAARSWEDRFAIATAAIARRVDAGRAVDPEVEFCWQQMMVGRGQVRVERLATEVGWSRKRLWSRFRSQLGLTPKRAAQLVRFDDAAHRLAAGQSVAAAAAASGYADQSHLHREVLAFTGTTPATLATVPFLAIDDLAWPA